MAQEYQVAAVSPETRTFSTQYGEMISYKLKFEGDDAIVELGQKTTTPAPQKGDSLYGTIDMSGKFGPKFKKEQRQQMGFGGGFPASQTGSPQQSTGGHSSKGTFNADPFTMYLSYAKDIAVAPAMFDAKGKFNTDLYAEVLEAVSTGAKTLYSERPGAEKPVSSDPVVQADADPKEMRADIKAFFGDADEKDDDDKPIDVSEIPF